MKFVATIIVMLGFTTTAFADWKVGLSVGYSPNYIANLKGTGVSSGTPYTADYSLNYASTTEFGIDVWNTPQNAWGFISGYQYGGERKFTSGTLNGFPISAASNTSKYQTHFLYVGTAYRWQSFYIPLGLTYGITKFTPATPMEVDYKSGVGAHLGIGWFIGDHAVIEYIGRSATAEVSATSGADSETLTGIVGSALLSFKYFF